MPLLVRSPRRAVRASGALLACLLLGSLPCRASGSQQPTASTAAATRDTTVAPTGPVVAAGAPEATREQLTQALRVAEARAADAGRSAAERNRAKEEVASITRRLEQGDLRAGDRLLITITVDSVSRNEVVVRADQMVELGSLPALSLQGVLRSEVAAAVEQHLRRYYRSPQVRVEMLLRISITGGVSKPGPYSLLPDISVVDMLSVAGGLTTTSRTDRISVMRGGKAVVSPKRFQQAVSGGETLKALGLQSGDEVSVAIRRPRDPWRVAQVGFFALSGLIAILSLIRASYQY